LVRWSRPEQLHLTLKFLGDVAADRVTGLKVALGNACEGHAQFQLALENVGCFPNLRNPRVIWIGVSGDVDKLQELRRRVDAQTRDFGEHSEGRDFQPHLTIGRVKAEPRRAKAVGDAVEQTRVGTLGEWTVCEVELIQSELLPQGACYTQLSAVRLGQSVPTTSRAVPSPSL